MPLTRIDLLVFVLYMAAVIGLGFAASRRKQSKREYFLAGDKLPWWMVGGSIVASNISSHQLVGVMGIAYTRGFVAMTIEWGAILLGFNALLWVFLPFYLRNGFYTVPEFLNRRFGSAARTTYATLILLTYVFVEISAVLYLGALALHSIVAIPVLASIIVLAVATGLYTILGGLKAVVWTEMLQLGVLLLGGLALSVAAIRAVGGIHGVLATAPQWHLLLPASDPDFPWTMYLGGLVCISVFYCAANQFIVQRALAAKNEYNARMGIVFTDYLKFIFPLIVVVPGLVAPILLPHLASPDLVFPTLVQRLLPSGLVGLVMAALIAAVMGHTSGAINSCTTIAAIDFYQPWARSRALRARQLKSEASPVLSTELSSANEQPSMVADDASTVLFGQFFGVLVIIAGVCCAELLTAHPDKPVFLYLLNAYGYFTPGVATMFLLGIFWRRATHAGAMTAGVLSIPLSLAMQWRFSSMPFFNRTGIVFWICMAACVVVSLCTAPKSAQELEGLIWTKESLSLPRDSNGQRRGLRGPFFAWVVITLVVLYFYIRFR